MTSVVSRQVDGEPALHCLQAGSPSWPAVVLLHSLGTDSGIWVDQIRALGREHHVLAPDSRGHGASDWRAPLDLAGWVDDLERILDAFEVDAATLVGLSMGGVQALACAIERPRRVDGLVLADSFAELDPALARDKVERLAGQAQRGGMVELADAYVEETLTVPATPARAALVRDAIATMDPDAYVDSARACFEARLGHRLGDVRARTLVLWGDQDVKTPRELSERLAAEIPDAALAEIPGAGHLSSLENPAAFTAAVAGFTAGAGVGAGGSLRR